MGTSFVRWVPIGGVCLLAFRLVACSNDVTAPMAGGAAGNSDENRAPDGGGNRVPDAGGNPAPDGGGTRMGMPCSLLYGDCEIGRHCSGDTIVREQVACVDMGGANPNNSGQCADGPAQAVMIPCAEGLHCSAGLCLSHAAAPAKACVTPTDCGLPRSTCAERDLVIFSDPSCDEGQCHWKEILESCGGASPGCVSGQCAFPPAMMTAVGPLPDPMPDRMQPAAAPPQVCNKASDCVAPAPTCYRASTVTYVNPACEAGSCVFGLDISECSYPMHACLAGVCQ